MDQQFSLSWNNFHGNLTKGFAGLLGKGEFVDVTIAVDGHLLQAHKVILSICSPYFKKMFQMNPCQHPIVVLRDVTHKAMRDLLQFMYHGEVSVKQEDLTSFIGTAEVLQIKGLTNKETDDEEAIENKTQSITESIIKTHNHTTKPDVNDDIDTSQESQSKELDLSKQTQYIEKLQRLNNLKRKSEEYLQKNYYATDLFDKRPKFKEKPVTTHNSTFQNNYNVYDENPVNITSTLNTAAREENISIKHDSKNHDQMLSPESNLQLKTECEDNDIVTDPAVCNSPKNYETRDSQKDCLDYSTTQDSALSLVVNESENSSLPSRYKYIYSRKGHKQLVHMNFVYTKHSTTHGKTSWRCVQYFSLNRCPATVETVDDMILAVNHQHNHDNCYDKLVNVTVYEMNDTETFL